MAALGPTTNLSATTSILPQQDRSARSGCRRCCCSTWGNDGEGVPHPRRGDADHRRERDDGGGGAYARDGARRQSTAGDARRFRRAGPLHAGHVAAKLRVGRVMVPLRAGVLSALGLLVVPPAYDIVRTHKVPLKELDAASTGTLMEEMADSIAALPGSPPSCHARFVADSKSHQLDRELSALGPITNLTTTAPILLQQRRSAGCFSCPSPDHLRRTRSSRRDGRDLHHLAPSLTEDPRRDPRPPPLGLATHPPRRPRPKVSHPPSVGEERPARRVPLAPALHPRPRSRPAHRARDQRYAHAKTLITRYAQRIENAICDAVRFFHIDALSSAVAMKVDFDMTLLVIASGLYRRLAQRMRG